jgi:hypothetical protein
MPALQILAQLRDAGLTVTRSGDKIIVAPKERITEELRTAIREAKPQLLTALESTADLEHGPLSPIQEKARAEVLAQLVAHPNIKRAFVNRFADDGTMIVTLAIREVGTGELHIPAERFSQSSLDDYGALLECIEGSA